MSIKIYIDRWLGARSNRTLSSLSRATEVPLSTIRRLYSGDGGLPDSKSTLPVLAAVCSVDEMSAYVKQNYPEVSKFYEILGHGFEKHSAPEMLDSSVFRTRESYLSYALAYAGLASEERIRGLFGAYGVQAADELVASGILTKRIDEYVPIDGKSFAFTNRHESNCLSVAHILTTVKPESKHDNAFSMVFSTDDQGRAEAEALIKKFSEDLITICKREAPNKHALALGLAYSRIIDDTPVTKKEDLL